MNELIAAMKKNNVGQEVINSMTEEDESSLVTVNENTSEPQSKQSRLKTDPPQEKRLTTEDVKETLPNSDEVHENCRLNE